MKEEQSDVWKTGNGPGEGSTRQTKRANVASPQAHCSHLEIENADEKNQADAPTGLGQESIVNGCSKTHTAAIS